MSPLALSLRLLQTQPDSRLLALARGGHEPAFEVLVRRYRRPLLAYSRGLSAGVGAEDVLQQALLQAWRALRDGAEVNDARAWLYRIVHNATISAVRRAGAPPARLVDTPSISGVEQVVEQRLAAREALSHIAALPELQREVMLGTALEGRSHEELASELGLSGSSVRGLLYRARAALRSAAAALIPSPALDWAIRTGAAARAGSPYEALAGGASVGVAGAVIKGGVAATFVGTLAGAAIVGIHPAARVHHHARSGLISTRPYPGSNHPVRHGSILLAAASEPGPSAGSSAPEAHRARPATSAGATTTTMGRIGTALSALRNPETRRGSTEGSGFRDGRRSGSGPSDRSSSETRAGSRPDGQDPSRSGQGTDGATSASAAPEPAPSGTTSVLDGGLTSGAETTSSGADAGSGSTTSSGGTDGGSLAVTYSGVSDPSAQPSPGG